MGRRSCTVFLLFFRSRKPADTSFSKILARVAGGPQTFSLGILRHILFSGSLHRGHRVSSVKCWGGLLLPSLDDCRRNRKGLSFSQLRQGFLCTLFFRLCILRFGTVSVLQCFPSGVPHRFSFGGKFLTGHTLQSQRFPNRYGAGPRRTAGAGPPAPAPLFLPQEGRKVCILEISGRDYCVVVGYFLIVDDCLRITGNGDPLRNGIALATRFTNTGRLSAISPVRIAAVSTGIGAELLFIQALQIVQGLLGCKSKQAVGISLQSSQVIEGRRLFGLFLALHFFDCDSCTLTGSSSCSALARSLMRSPDTVRPGSSSATV